MSLKYKDIKFTALDTSAERSRELDRQMRELDAYIQKKREEGAAVRAREERLMVKNPYRTALLTKKVERIKKARQLMASRKPGNEKGYVWSMGYNNLTSRYTPEGSTWHRFSGSSINRKPKINDYAKNIPPATRDLLAMARKVCREMLNLRRIIPREVLTYLRAQTPSSEREFRGWLSRQDDRDIFTNLPIHMLSARSRGKIKDKATAFFRASVGDRVFCTLTFVNEVSDYTGCAILNKFLVSLRKKFKNLQYLWVAERQEKNEDFPHNIHFHLILNKRLPVRYYNALWVLQQYNAGLTAKNKFGMEISREEVEIRFREGTIQKILNPLDVKRVRTIHGLSMYLTKYITKQKKNQPFGCANWHCSRKVSGLFTRAAVERSAFAFMTSIENARVDKQTGECFLAKPIRGQFYVMIYANNKEGPIRYLREMELINKWMLREDFHVSRDCIEITDEIYNSHYKRN